MSVERVLPANAVRPIWSSASALVYIGGLVSLLPTVVLLGLSNDRWGEWALVGTSLLAAATALGLAVALDRAGRAVATGVAALLAVVFAAVVVGAVLGALGALDAEVGQGEYQPAALLVEAALVAGALLGIARFRTPLLVLPAAVAFWFALADLSSLGSWEDGAEWLSVLAGAVLVLAGVAVDRAGRAPYAFWLHTVGALALGGGIAALAGDGGWLVIALVALAFIAAAFVLGRSSYAVLGAIGILLATTLFAVDPLSIVGGFVPFAPVSDGDSLEGWEVALSYLVAGLLLFGIGVGERSLRPARDVAEPG